MTTLITGGCGFVMANLVHRLARDPRSRTIVLDASAPDQVLLDWLAECPGSVEFVQGDVTDVSQVSHVCGSAPIETVVHGATITDQPSWERRDPARYLSINVGGTVAVLEAVRRTPSIERVLYVSSGAVYGDLPQPHSVGAVDEDTPRAPQELYGISKDSAERIVERYGQLFGRVVTSVRLSGVFGPLERLTAFRRKHSPVYPLVHAAAERRRCRVSSRSLVAVADLISSEDVAEAMQLLIRARAPRPAYNIALGRLVTIPDVLETLAAVADGFSWQVVDDAGPGDLDVDVPPVAPNGRYGAYAVDRLLADTQWRPRPFADQIASYLGWMSAAPERRARDAVPTDPTIFEFRN